MSDPSNVQKLIRRARKLEEKSRNVETQPQERALLLSKVNGLEQEIATLIFDPHIVGNSELEQRRTEQLLKRKSTTPVNRAKRQRKADEARLALSNAMLEAAKVNENARKIIDMLMGRAVEEKKSA